MVLYKGFMVFGATATFPTCGVGGRVAVVTIPSNLGLKPLVTHFASVATMFGESMPFHCVFRLELQTAVETAIKAMAI